MKLKIAKIEELTEQLMSTNEETRRTAILTLAGYSLYETKGFLFRAMGDDSWRIRKEAVETLLTGGITEELVEELVGLLGSHDNAGLRNSAVEVLERLGNRAVPVLCRYGEFPDHDVRKFVLDILGSIGDDAALPIMVKALDDPEPNVSAAAAENLGKIGNPGAVPFLLQSLEKTDIWLRYTILEALGKIGKPVPLAVLVPLAGENLLKKALFDCLAAIGDGEALPLLFDGIMERVRNIREAAVTALMKVRDRLPSEDAERLVDHRLAQCNGAPFVEGLLASLDTSDRNMKESLVRLLGLIGDERAIGGLLQGCRDDRLRRLALQAIMSMGERAATAIKGLFQVEDDDMRCIVAYICGELRFADCGPLLLKGMRDDNPLLRRVSVIAAGKTGIPGMIDGIAMLLQDDDPAVRSGSIEALSLLAEEDGGAVHRIAGCLANSSDPEKRRNAALLYGALADGKSLALLIKDEEPMVRRTAAAALSSLKKGAGVSHLIMALADEDADVRIAAAQALSESGGEEVLHPLLLALKDEDQLVRCAALKSLGKLTLAGAREAVMAILDGPEDGLLTITALETLARIGGEGVTERIMRALQSSDEEIVKSAMEILSDNGKNWIEECRERLLAHPHWDVRRNFIRIMVDALGNEALPHLRPALDRETDVLVREKILEILDRYR